MSRGRDQTAEQVDLAPATEATGTSVDYHRGPIALIATSMKIEFIDYARRNRLVLLAEIEKQRVRNPLGGRGGKLLLKHGTLRGCHSACGGSVSSRYPEPRNI